MRIVRLTCSVCALALSAAASAQTGYPAPYPASAPRQASPYAGVPTPYGMTPPSDADALAGQIRLLAANPQDLAALVRAGELALKLDDDTAAAAFFARAERIDPRNARVKAGEGSLLVKSERPGDALRHFVEAERLGGDPRSFAADRGLAYDLIGEQDRAQRDYRLALRGGPNEETQRRYALSLGISGKRDLALTQIDTLLRKSDRGAWRARAFILAMSGDKAGAEKIATSMMPSGMAQGLQPFFDVLGNLRPADRAFAVHFGEVRPNIDRLNDARLVPPLAALAPDPTAPVQVAAVAKPVVVALDPREERRRAREARRNRGRAPVAIAATVAPPPQPLPPPPVYAGTPPRTAFAANLPGRTPTNPPGVTFVQRVPGTASVPGTTSAYAPPVAARATSRAPITATQSANLALSAPLPPGSRSVPAPNGATPPRTVQLATVSPPPPVAMGAPVSPAARTSGPAIAAVTRPAPVTGPGSGQAYGSASGSVYGPVQTPIAGPTPPAPAPAPVPRAVPAPTSPVVLASSNTPLSRNDPGVTALTTRLGVPPVAVPSNALSGASSSRAPATEALSLPSAVQPPPPALTAPPAPSATPGASRSATGASVAASAPSATPPVTPPAIVLPTAGSSPAASSPATSSPAASTPATSTPAAPIPAGTDTSSLAAIISDIKVPAAEQAGLDAAATSPRATAPGPAPADPRIAEQQAALEKKAADKKAADQAALAEAKKAAADKKLADAKKAAADKKAADAKKAADKKLADAKKAAEEKRKNDPKLLEPSRVWVQVAGGANEKDLPKQWSKLRSGNALLAGRSGWTTPLRATNRIVTGPFKTEDEAQAFVNKLTKAGLSGFVFVSDAGQKITKLGAK